MHRRHTHQHKPHAPKKVVKPVLFMFMGEAQSVSVIGEFNEWNPAANPMTQGVDGAWRAEIPIVHGHHHYLLLVDGKPVLDPRANGIARNESGEKVSLLAVS